MGHSLKTATLVAMILAGCGGPGGSDADFAGSDAIASSTADLTALDPLKVVAIKASANDGNVPANAVDGSFSTRWSCDGKGCWIQADLGASMQVGGVDLAWYKGNTRSSYFTVRLSNDGSTFTTAFSGKSSGATTGFERSTFAQASARYVRIVVNGNTDNNWASLTELKVLGSTGTTTTTTDPTTSTGGSTTTTTTDPTTTTGSTTTTTTTTTTDTGADRFGVKMIYPSKAAGESWTLADDPTRDPRFDPQNTITKNGDGSWKMKSSQVRMQVKTSTGYDSSKIKTYNRNTLAQQGYMQAPNDWKNVEITGYVKANSVSDKTDNFAWYARGGRHTDSLACEGSAYKGDLYYDGRTRFAKESWHVSYDYTPYQTATTSIVGRWVGYKAVIRNVVQNGKTVVNLQVWLNDNADKVTWKKVLDKTDDGAWAGDSDACGASDAKMPMTWGGPLAVFRWDSATDVDFKWLSVREID